MCGSKNLYDEMAGRYEKMLSPLEKAFLYRMRKEAIRHLPERTKILEVGAGTGLNFAHYPPGSAVTATDISLGMLEIAAQKSQGTEINIAQADAEVLPFAADSFDAAFCTLVFCSIPEPMAALAEICRVVKNKGTFVLLEHVRPDGLLGPVFDVLNRLTVHYMDDHFNRRTADSVSAAGFEIVSVTKRFGGIINLIVCRNLK